MTLDKAQPGQTMTILILPRGQVYAQLIRFGLVEGMTIKCIEKVSGGPVIIEHSKQEIAIGQKLAKKIEIKLNPILNSKQRLGGEVNWPAMM